MSSSDRLTRLQANAEARAKILSGETPTTSNRAEEAPPQQEQEITPVSVDSPADKERKKQEREARLLAKAELRMKVVNGEVKVEDKVKFEKQEGDNRGRWERQWEETSAQTEAREVPPEFLNKLDVTAEMAVEAPKSKISVEEELAAIRRINQKLAAQSDTVKWRNLDLPAVLTSLALCLLGVLSGQTDGSALEQVWLPFSSLVIIAFVLRVLAVTSFQALGLHKPATAAGGANSHWMIKMAMPFLPPPIAGLANTVMSFAAYVKDSHDDMLLFVFAHGVTYNVIKRLTMSNEVELVTELQEGEFKMII